MGITSLTEQQAGSQYQDLIFWWPRESESSYDAINLIHLIHLNLFDLILNRWLSDLFWRLQSRDAAVDNDVEASELRKSYVRMRKLLEVGTLDSDQKVEVLSLRSKLRFRFLEKPIVLQHTENASAVYQASGTLHGALSQPSLITSLLPFSSTLIPSSRQHVDRALVTFEDINRYDRTESKSSHHAG